MATSWNSVNVLCPFYLSDTSKTIKCECIISSKYCEHCFNSSAKKENIMRVFCDDMYQQCPFFLSLMETKYFDY